MCITLQIYWSEDGVVPAEKTATAAQGDRDKVALA